MSEPDPITQPEEWVNSQLPPNWDWKNPDYDAIVYQRVKRLEFLRETPGAFDAVLRRYAKDDGFYSFIFDWTWVVDPRLGASGGDTTIPFVPFPRQVEALTWMESLVKAPLRKESGKGNLAKTRGCGASTLAIAWLIWRWRFRAGAQMGIGSNLERNVWSRDNPKSLFWKAKNIIEYWPQELLPKGFDIEKHLKRGEGAGELLNPENGSMIHGDAGDQIGRGDRRLIYVIDEHTALQHPELAEAALMETTRTLIRLSTERKGSLFNSQIAGLSLDYPDDDWREIKTPDDRSEWWLRKRAREQKCPHVFPFDWYEDPRKSLEIIERERDEALKQGMLSIFAVEVLRDVESVSEETFIGLEILLEAAKRRPAGSGPIRIAVDIASTGKDMSVIAVRRGLFSYPLRKFGKTDTLGVELTSAIVQMAEDLLAAGHSIEAVVFELKEVGYAVYSNLLKTGLKTILFPFKPEQKLSDGKHYNMRALAWSSWKRAMISGAQCPNDNQLISLASKIRYELHTDSKGREVVMLEPKKAFRRRLNADPNNDTGGPSPDEADAVAMLWLPLPDKISPIDMYKYRMLCGIPDESDTPTNTWGWT